MATIEFSCPKCEKQIKAPDDLIGKKIKCKECLHVFTVKASAVVRVPEKAAQKADKGSKAGKGGAGKGPKEAVAAKAEEHGDDDDGKAYGVTDQSFLPRCAYCAKEMESEDQIVCLNCGYNHRTRERIQVEKTLEPTGGEWVLHLLPGVLCALVVLMAIGELLFSWIHRAEKEAAYADMAVNPFGLGIVIWRSVLWLFIGFFAGRFAIKRLILHPRPPEKEMPKKKKI